MRVSTTIPTLVVDRKLDLDDVLEKEGVYGVDFERYWRLVTFKEAETGKLNTLFFNSEKGIMEMVNPYAWDNFKFFPLQEKLSVAFTLEDSVQ